MRVDEFIPDSVKNVFSDNSVINNKTQADQKDNNSIDFESLLTNKLGEVNDKQVAADNITNQFVQGDDVDVHKVMLSTEQAKLSLELAVQIRNKLVDAYQEISRTQL